LDDNTLSNIDNDFSVSTQIKIRKALVQDAAAIAKLSNQLGYAANLLQIESRLQKLSFQSDHLVVVATLEESVRGWAHGFYTQRIESDPFVEIGGLIAHQEFRNAGIGKSLIVEIISWTKTIGAKKTRVRCNTIRDEAHAFYNNIGFTLKKQQKVFDFET